MAYDNQMIIFRGMTGTNLRFATFEEMDMYEQDLKELPESERASGIVDGTKYGFSFGIFMAWN
jgi:hypothetical protein